MITIVVLIILAGITINTLFSDDGVISRAIQAKETTKKTEVIESIQLDIIGKQTLKMGENITQAEFEEILIKYAEGGADGIIKDSDGNITGIKVEGVTDPIDIADLYTGDFSGSSGGSGDNVDNHPTVDSRKVADNIGTVISTTDNTDLADSYGNKITVPAGFHIVSTTEDSTVTYSYTGDGSSPAVQDGIVIADNDGNQFVWIPVGDIKNKDGTTSTITLGRYSSFTKTNDEYTPVQTIANYNTTVTISSYYQEDTSSNHTKGNTIAKDIGDFLTKANNNGGYYLARYEAGITGTTDNYSLSTKTTTDGTVKPLTKKGVGVWNSITQPNAATVAKAMYNTNNYVSDLVNSYAWDTAIIFIQTYSGNSTYASKKSVNTSLASTGASGDKVCNIYDMASNCREWSTETSPNSTYPCVLRGGSYYNQRPLLD